MTSLEIPEDAIILSIAGSNSSRQKVLDQLKQLNLGISVADRGVLGLDLASEILPDAILLHLDLPDIDSFETLRRLQSRDETKNIPIILIAAEADQQKKTEGYRLGAAGYLVEPILPEELIAQLKPHLTLRALGQKIAAQAAQLRNETCRRNHLLQDVDDFAYMVAHNLKNPLGVTISYAAFVKKFVSTMSVEDIQHDLDVIGQNGHKMERIIDELRLLVAVRTQEAPLAPLDMINIIDRVQDRLAEIIEAKQAELIRPDHWPDALGHHLWIEEVWLNYLSHALERDNRPLHIELGATVHKAEHLVEFWVQDNGPDLTPEQVENLFPPLDRLNQISAQGSGLGLALARYIIEKFGGRVGVDSDQFGAGMRLSFYLPHSAQSFDIEPEELNE